MWIKKFYDKLRFQLSWKYPLFYDYLRAAKFPLQILAVGLAMVAAVSFYNSHYSYEASLRKITQGKITEGKITQENGSLITQADTSRLDNVIVTTESTPVSSQKQLQVTLLQSEDELQQQVLKAETLLRDKKQQTKRLEEKVENAKSVLRASDQGTPGAVDFNPHSADWIQQQPGNHYVVQVAAATEQQLLLQYAQDKAFKPPVAIYPFKVNKDGQLVYGVSTGLFIVKDDAMTELPVLSKLSEEHGVWVRKVADIIDELAALKDNRLLQ